MAIVFTYPPIGKNDVQPSDRLLISQMTVNGNPTRSITINNLRQYIGAVVPANIVTGTGTTNRLTKWTDGPNSIIGDSNLFDNTTDVQSEVNFVLKPSGAGPSVGSVNLDFKGVDDTGAELVGGRIFTLDSSINPSGQDFYFQNADDNGVLQTNIFIDAFGFVGIGNTSPLSLLDVGGDFENSGNVKFTGYGSGTKTGTATYSLAVTAAGNVVEQPLPTILVNGLVNNLGSAASGGYDFMEWVSNVTSATQIPVMKTPRDLVLKSVSYSWMGDTALSIGPTEQIEFTMGIIPSGVNPIIANYTASVFLFDLDSADNNTYANDVATGFSIPFNAGDVIAVVGQETGTVTPNNGELSLTFEFELT